MMNGAKLQIFDEPYYQELKNWTITGYAFDNYQGKYWLKLKKHV